VKGDKAEMQSIRSSRHLFGFRRQVKWNHC